MEKNKRKITTTTNDVQKAIESNKYSNKILLLHLFEVEWLWQMYFKVTNKISEC